MSAFASSGHNAENAYRRYVPIPDLSRCSKTAEQSQPRKERRAAIRKPGAQREWRFQSHCTSVATSPVTPSDPSQPASVALIMVECAFCDGHHIR
jgi:hypothetical protein